MRNLVTSLVGCLCLSLFLFGGSILHRFIAPAVFFCLSYCSIHLSADSPSLSQNPSADHAPVGPPKGLHHPAQVRDASEDTPKHTGTLLNPVSLESRPFNHCETYFARVHPKSQFVFKLQESHRGCICEKVNLDIWALLLELLSLAYKVSSMRAVCCFFSVCSLFPPQCGSKLPRSTIELERAQTKHPSRKLLPANLLEHLQHVRLL